MEKIKIDGVWYEKPSPQQKSDPRLTTNDKTVVGAINELNHNRGTFTTIEELELAIPIGKFNDEATVDAGIGSDPFKYVWDVSDSKWVLSSGKAITVDQSVIEGSINPVSGGSAFNGLANKVDKNGTDRLITYLEGIKLAETSYVEFAQTEVVNGVVILDGSIKLYNISTAQDLTASINTSLVDLEKYIKFLLKINLNDYVTITFPDNFQFKNLDYPTETGEYVYEVTSSDNGDTWHLELKYKNITTVGIDVDGNEIVTAVIRYVDGINGLDTNNGLSWATALKNPQTAIDAAVTGDAVFVKGSIAGIKYLPTQLRDAAVPRSASFIMKSGVNVYGGFEGVEHSLYERDMVSYLQVMKLPSGTKNMYVDRPKYRSILSGEITGDSVLGVGLKGNQFTTASIANNAYSVVSSIVGNISILNGFEILGGNCNGTGIYSSGGGAYNCTITNCAIYNNSAVNGGGTSGCALTNCSIYSNFATVLGGGASASKLTNCAVYNNFAASGGGTIGGAITNCAIYNNSATTNNGGGTNAGIITNCAIHNNFASKGGGAAGGTLNSCSIYSNSANTGGGADGGASNVYLNNCFIFDNNSAASGGGISSLYGTAINCSIYNNVANTYGGGCTGPGSIINCSIIRNSCSTTGGGLYNILIKNSVVYGNKLSSGVKSNIYNDNSSAETYSAVEDEIRAGVGNISLSTNNEGDADSPYFITLSQEAGIVDEMYLSNPDIGNGSFLIDKGLDSYLTTGFGAIYDLLLRPRKVGIIDIGAYENQKI